MPRAGRELPVLALALASTACSVGWGTPYPGAQIRHREYVQCDSIIGSTCYGPEFMTETGGGGSFGLLVSTPLGGGRMRIGDRPGMLTVGTGARVDLNFARDWWGAGVSAEFALAFAEQEHDAGPIKSSFLGFPLGAYLLAAPIQPFVIRVGGGVAPGTATFGEVDTSVRGTFVTAGVGIVSPFPGMHWVPMLEWRRLSFGDIATDRGEEAMVVDTFMFTLWNVF